ncbi:exonuclease domain-containing protein [Polymorphospora rubra]|uniref:3'-5' exonuclease n=1 Tax=Polymorphospora rubra TaxID=338584 RepID=A0A810MQW1_9ACTN|nr:exonuclease domain-containing protein [Polymorphospora rubra]BCJ63666.1 3'-5' exonuclease [Polymorphospora rubra]
MINRYPGDCGTCHQRVEAGAGQAVNTAGRWLVYHQDCIPVRTAPKPGTHPGWHDLPIVGFDIEGTSAQPMESRILTAALIPGEGPPMRWTINPGVPIPPDATERHGIDDDMVRREGEAPAVALAQIGTAIAKLIADSTPLVAFFASYDVTVLHNELARHGLPPIEWERAIVIDPHILHREVEPRWYGKRTLGDLCDYYQVRLAVAHESVSDARAAADLARGIAARHERIARMSPDALHQAQIGWHREQGLDLQGYFDRVGKQETVNLEWPLETAVRG